MTDKMPARGAKGKFQRFRKALAALHSSGEAGMPRDGLEDFIIQKFGVGYKTAKDDIKFLEGTRTIKVVLGVVTITERGFEILDNGKFPGED